MKIGIGLYGRNGHQIAGALVDNERAALVAVAEIPADALPPDLHDAATVQHVATLDELLADSRVELVSLCSPRRCDQAADAIRCLEAGKHVYAEKPCAMTEEELDAIIATARRTGLRFHEMAGTAFDQPYWAMREAVRQGVIGEVIQVLAQKSYPYYAGRPQDEDIDGGLIMQNGVHALRFIEHVAGIPIQTIEAVETGLGNPVPGGGLRMAASYMMRLENGGVATAVANYLNQPGMGSWGNEHLRIFGSLGFMESVDGGARTRLIVGEQDRGPLDTEQPSPDFLGLILDEIRGGPELPFDLPTELHPTRMVIRAKQSALSA